MPDIEFAVNSTPGEHAHEGRGRLINMYAEPIVDDRAASRNKGQEKVKWRRTSGSTLFGSPVGTPTGSFRGSHYAAGQLYAAFGTELQKFGSSGGTGTALTGTLPGTSQVIFARNNKSPPDIVAVSPGDGAFLVTDTTVSAYPDVDLPAPNSVCFLLGFFFFSIGDGKMYASQVNSTAVNALDFATAESRPDALLRVVPMPSGQLLACGDTSMEVWGPPINTTGFPLSYITTITTGLIGRNAIAGYDDGFSAGLFYVAADFCVYTLAGYKPTKVSPPDLERKIRQTVDRDSIEVSVYNSNGRGLVIVQSPEWCWHFDCSTMKWHERESYLVQYWRHMRPTYAFNKWIAGDRKVNALYSIDHESEKEANEPLITTMEGIIDVFPEKTRVARIDINYTHGVGINSSPDKTEIDPKMLISYSTDGGMNWSDPCIRPFGQMGQANGQITVRNCGMVRGPSYKVRLQVSDSINFSILGGVAQPAGA